MKSLNIRSLLFQLYFYIVSGIECTNYISFLVVSTGYILHIRITKPQSHTQLHKTQTNVAYIHIC